MRGIALLLLLSIVKVSLCSAQTVLGTSNWEEGKAILALKDGSKIIAGNFRLTPKASLDIFVLHLSKNNEILDGQRFGGPKQDDVTWMLPTKDGGFLQAGYAFEKEGGFGRHDIYLLKFSAEVELEWQRLHGRPFREIPFCVRETTFGYVVGGYTKSQGLHGDYFLMAVDENGNALWDHYYEAPYVDIGHSVVACPGGYLIAGSTAGYHFPSQANHHYPQSNVMVIRTDSNGQEIERRFYGGERHEFARAMEVAPGGGYYIFGSSQDEQAGDFDFWLMRLDEQLDTVWTRRYQEEGSQEGTCMAIQGGEIMLSGTVEGASRQRNLCALKVNLEGEKLEKMVMEMEHSSYGMGVTTTSTNGFIGIGYLKKSPLDRDILLWPY